MRTQEQKQKETSLICEGIEYEIQGLVTELKMIKDLRGCTGYASEKCNNILRKLNRIVEVRGY
jgi:hypothetical protein